MGIQQDNIRYTVSPCFAQFDKILHLDESCPTTRTEQPRASTSGQCKPSKSNGEPKSGEGRRQGCCGCRMAPKLKGRRHGRCRRRSSSPILQRESDFSRLSLMPLHPSPPPWTPLMADRRAHKLDTPYDSPSLVTAHQLDFPSVRLDTAVGRNTALLLHLRSPFRALYPIPTQPFRQLNLAVNAQLAHPARFLTGRQHAGRRGSTRCRFDSRLERDWSWRSHRRAQVWPRRRCRGHDMEQRFEGIECAWRCGRVLGRSLGRGGEEGTPEMEGRPGVRRNDDESQRERTVHSDRVSATVFLGLGR